MWLENLYKWFSLYKVSPLYLICEKKHAPILERVFLCYRKGRTVKKHFFYQLPKITSNIFNQFIFSWWKFFCSFNSFLNSYPNTEPKTNPKLVLFWPKYGLVTIWYIIGSFKVRYWDKVSFGSKYGSFKVYDCPIYYQIYWQKERFIVW